MHFHNEALWLVFLLLDFGSLLLVYRLFGRDGLYAYIVLAVIACNLQVLKLVDLFGMTVTLGNILYGSIFLATDILGEVHGKADARKAVWLGFTASIMVMVYMQLALLYTPAAQDQMQPHLAMLFGFMPRVVAGSLAAYLMSQFCDVWLFHVIRNKTKGRFLWLRNNAATLISQALDTTVFNFVAFAPVPLLGHVPGFDWPVVLTLWWTTYVIKTLVALLDTPFAYFGRSIGRKWHNAAPAQQ